MYLKGRPGVVAQSTTTHTESPTQELRSRTPEVLKPQAAWALGDKNSGPEVPPVNRRSAKRGQPEADV